MVNSRAAFQCALHGWYALHQRRLPWRDSPSLYKTVVSEFMLQQTQVVTVLPYFDRWLRALPDFAALAAAPEAKVMKLWEGLGYYSRARNLHKLAQAWVAAPAKPRTPAEWRELPGIGPYTAAAITSISFDESAAVVDGNVVRILARLTNEHRQFRDGTEAVKHFTPLADELIPGAHPGTHNQAMMELGATVCFRQKPLCLTCPVAEFCAARRCGDPETLPRLKPKQIEAKFVIRTFCLDRDRLLLRRGHASAKLLVGLHELPEASDLGVKPTAATLVATKRRAITRFAITEAIHAVKPTAALRATISRSDSLEWIPLDQLDRITLSGPHRRWIQELLKR
ncbi:A/G-specific adenine glycosylase [Oleiharenicola lentus]|uniref:A/G-specific adenine glycosylase n=1 Tax=Oleiharenicola lentus TaxID=2508720 RepID=UPI001FEB4C33|nr:A/G-specific adenine glycosylase [Oleiharenicola lentus]